MTPPGYILRPATGHFDKRSEPLEKLISILAKLLSLKGMTDKIHLSKNLEQKDKKGRNMADVCISVY